MLTRPAPGFRFKNNRLHIFSSDAVMLIDSWPELKCVRKITDRDCWQPYHPEFRIIKPYRRSVARKKSQAGSAQLEMAFHTQVDRKLPPSLPTQRKKAFDQFRFSIPKPVAARVEKFTNRQWALLRLFEKEPRALDVCRSNPALTFALAHAANFRAVRGGDSLQFAAAYILEKQRVLLDRINFPATTSSVKVMSKVVPE